MANEGVEGSPTKNMIMLVVTATGQGDNPRYTLYFAFPKILSDRGPKVFPCPQERKMADGEVLRRTSDGRESGGWTWAPSRSL